MLTLYHAPDSRSSAIVTLIHAMGIADQINIRTVTIIRQDGSGTVDPTNPHPEGKVPVLVHDGEVITERGAIILHLCALFPDSGVAPHPGTAAWGRFATWLVWYQGVLEPVLIHQGAGLAHPWLTATFRGPDEAARRLHDALKVGPWLMGDAWSAADLLVHSPYAWFTQLTPDDALIGDWVARCIAQSAQVNARALEQAASAAA